MNSLIESILTIILILMVIAALVIPAYLLLKNMRKK
jgi:predicted transporter